MGYVDTFFGGFLTDCLRSAVFSFRLRSPRPLSKLLVSTAGTIFLIHPSVEDVRNDEGAIRTCLGQTQSQSIMG